MLLVGAGGPGRRRRPGGRSLDELGAQRISVQGHDPTTRTERGNDRHHRVQNGLEIGVDGHPGRRYHRHRASTPRATRDGPAPPSLDRAAVFAADGDTTISSTGWPGRWAPSGLPLRELRPPSTAEMTNGGVGPVGGRQHRVQLLELPGRGEPDDVGRRPRRLPGPHRCRASLAAPSAGGSRGTWLARRLTTHRVGRCARQSRPWPCCRLPPRAAGQIEGRAARRSRRHAGRSGRTARAPGLPW